MTMTKKPLPSVPVPAHVVTDKLHNNTPFPSSTSITTPETSQSQRPRHRSNQSQTHQRVLSSFLPRMNTSSLLPTLHEPAVLAALISHLDWADVHTLFSTGKGLRDIFQAMHLRDIVLSRFVPGYAFCLRHRNMDHYQDIPITIHDLDLLLISQRTVLHRYPTHALRTLSSLYPTFEDDSTTSKLIALTQAHSRFVLLLQSLVHSSSEPLPFEQPEDFKAKSRFLPVQTLRELTFPAPLAFSDPDPDSEVHTPPPPSSFNVNAPSASSKTPSGTLSKSSLNGKHKHSRSQPSSSSNLVGLGGGGAGKHHQHHKSAHHLPHAQQASSPGGSLRGPTRPSANSLSSMMSSNDTILRKGRRVSIFGKNAANVRPPPPEEPHALKIYSNSWRRTKHAYSASSAGAMGDENMAMGDFGDLKRPNRRFASEHASSSDSSISARSSLNYNFYNPYSAAGIDTPSSSSSGASPPPLPPFPSGYPYPYVASPMSMPGYTPPRMYTPPPPPPPPMISRVPSAPSSLHDLRFATLRTRAPVLRCFVPSQDEALEACEAQLQDSGLWEHLSTGDVVCNLGYIPPAVPEEGEEDGAGMGGGDEYHQDGGGITMRPRSSSRSLSGGTPSLFGAPAPGPAQKKWLLFDGSYLVPYTPPDLLPLPDPLSLPSPFYYSHIMPPYSSPQYIISRLPAVHDDIPQMTLVHSTSKVPSPHSPKGCAVVRRWAWTARVVRMRMGGGDEGVGEGWFGEWVLEYEGTKEGREVLMDVLRGEVMGRRRWEVVRERSGAGRLWLKLLPL